MGVRSFYKPNAEHKPRPRKVDYNLIYELKDKGWKMSAICAELKIGQGTLRHALIRRKQGKN